MALIDLNLPQPEPTGWHVILDRFLHRMRRRTGEKIRRSDHYADSAEVATDLYVRSLAR